MFSVASIEDRHLATKLLPEIKTAYDIDEQVHNLIAISRLLEMYLSNQISKDDLIEGLSEIVDIDKFEDSFNKSLQTNTVNDFLLVR